MKRLSILFFQKKANTAGRISTSPHFDAICVIDFHENICATCWVFFKENQLIAPHAQATIAYLLQILKVKSIISSSLIKNHEVITQTMHFYKRYHHRAFIKYFYKKCL